MTQPQPAEAPDNPHDFLRECHRVDALYSYAYGYLEGVVANYLQALSPAEVLRHEYDELVKEVSRAIERIAREQVRARQGLESAGGWLSGASNGHVPGTITDRFERMEEPPENRS
jgi:hypothetical protein